ncbi:hypothetical protein, partial [Klebsiella sp. 95070]|uniref:hypothetical protein n=2 Tax=Klebsiella/Raoultella group TaxID=2890311 RepID=UPI0030060FA5
GAQCALKSHATNALPGLIELHTNNIISGTPQAHIPQARQAQRRRGGHPRGHTHLCAGWRYAYPAYGILP